MVKKVNINEFEKIIKIIYKQKDDLGRKVPLLVKGTFGIGKSEAVRETGKEIAKERGKEFIEWNKSTKEEKEAIFSNPNKYFVLIDIRLSEFDSSDVKGLPDFKEDKTSIEWKIPFWAKVLEQKESDGVLFFDEINLATPLVISSTYKIIYDRVVNDSKINDNWLIIGCGNKDDDRAYTHELASPVRDRGCEIELVVPSADEWVEWAIKHNIDSRIIGFISWKPSNLHNVNFEDEQKFTTHRGWNRLNTLIRDIDDYATLELISGTAIGEGIAREFCAFCKIKDEIKLDEIMKNPELLKKVTEISTKYFVISALAEKYKENKLDFLKIFKTSEVLDEMKCSEFVVLLWRLCFKYTEAKWRKDFTTKELNNKIREKYSKYLL
jgi:hypothetical protein